MKWILLGLVGCMAMSIQPARATPDAQPKGEAIVIPFDPPIGETLRFRTESSRIDKDEIELSWSVDDFRFEEAEDGYRLTVETVSHGSNEDDPVMREFMNRLGDLTKKPFVLRISEDAQIMELEDADEYRSGILKALEESFRTTEPRDPGYAQRVEAVIRFFSDMSAEVWLAQLTEPVQPLVEFGWTELSLGESVVTKVEVESALGPVNREIAITLTRVADGLAHLTVRTSISREELERLVGTMFERMGGAAGAAMAEDVKAAMAELEHFKEDTVADYRVSVEDGMLHSFHSTQTVTVVDDGKANKRQKILSLKRLD